MKPRLLRLALIVAVAGCAPAAPTPPPAVKEIPLLPGTTWIYIDETGREMSTRVEGPALLDGIPCVKLRGCSVGVSESRWESQDVAYWSTRDGLLLLHGTGESDWQLTARTAVPLFQPTVARGSSWQGRFASPKDPRTGLEEAAGCTFISGGREEIATAAGVFDTCHVVEEWKYRGQVKVRIESWYAEEVGLVRQWYRTYNAQDQPIRTLRIELKAFLAVQKGSR